MEKLSNGNTILVYEESTAHYDNDYDVIHVRFSDDDGATWTDADVDLSGNPVVGFPNFPDGGALDPLGPGTAYVWQAPNGDVWLHTWLTDYVGAVLQGAWRTKSSDGGLTWGAWEQLIVDGFTEAENTYTGGIEEQHFIVDGVVYAVVRVYGVYWSTVKASFIRSDDNGATWTKISDLSTYSDRTHEMAMEYLGDGNILVLCRDGGEVRTLRITSDDFGLTWSDIIDIHSSSIGSIGRNRMFTDAHLKGQDNWWTDQKMIMVGFDHTNPGFSAGRRNAIWLSVDHGYTWTAPIYLDVGDVDGGYGDLIYDSNTDTYRVVTYKGTQEEANLIQYNFKVAW